MQDALGTEKPVSHQLRVHAVVNKEGGFDVVTEFADGFGFSLGRDEALGFAFVVLSIVRGLFGSVDELNEAILKAQASLVSVKSEPAERPKVQ